MLTPEQLKDIPDYFVDLYQDLEQFVISDFSRRVEKAGSITDTAEWQAIRAQEIGMSMSELEKEIKRVTELSQSEIDALMKGVAELSLENDAPLYEQTGKLAPNLEKSETLQNYVKAAQEQTKGELFNMTQSMGFARMVNGKIEYLPMFEFYNKALDLAQFQVSTGVLDYNTATRNAVKQIAQSGLRWVDYESGWHNRIDVAARRAIMTGVNQMSSKFNDQVVDDLGADYVEVTAHSGARPDHMSWQGKVFKIRGSSKGYPNLAAVTGLGTGPGLCGWNCRHNYYAFFPGISVPTYSEKELKNIDPPPFEYEGKAYTHYEATQKQRQIETAMRQSKNELIGYDAIGDKTAFTTTSIKLQRQKEFYRDFSKAADLPYQNDRHQVLKFDRSISQKSVWANKQATHEKYKDYLGTKTAKQTVDKVKEIEYNKEKWLLDGYIKAVKNGDLPPLTGIDNYLKTAREINKELVGLLTSDGVEIKGFVPHFVDRIIGQTSANDPPVRNKRQGVAVGDVKEALQSVRFDETIRASGKKSQRYINDRCIATINPDTGILVQTNPKGGKNA